MLIIGIPTYDNAVNAHLAGCLINEAGIPDAPQMVVIIKSLSILTNCFNSLWSFALNNRDKFDHFLMLHSDVVPTRGFTKALIEEMGRTQADVLSVALPIKDSRGLTSTALLRDHKKAHLTPERERRRRVTLRELAKLPETFDARDLDTFYGLNDKRPVLLVNTGMMLVDMRKPWVERIHFHFNDAVLKRQDGIYLADNEPEDWVFSREAADLGAKVLCTRKLKARHIGRSAYPNFGEWGELEEDTKTPEEMEMTQ